MPKKKLVFATFFPGCLNFHLTKDVGMIPYVLYRDFGYDSYLICYKNDDLSYLNTDVKGLKLLILRKSWCHVLEKWIRSISSGGLPARAVEALCTFIDTLPFMLRYARRIDILQVYHYKDESIIATFLYKLFNPRGMVYLKLDLHPDVVELCKKDPGVVKVSKIYDIARFDVISVEYSEALNILRQVHPVFKKYVDRLYYIPNGIDAPTLSRYYRDYDKKENMVLHAGRLGMPQKASEIALEAFARLAKEFPRWKLVFIGSMEERFAEYYRAFLENNSDIKDRLQYPGFIESREDVYEYYGKAKIFIFPSRYESFGLVALEAGCMGDALLASDIPPVRDITDNGKYGYLCEVDNIDCFTEKLRHIMTNENEASKAGASLSGYIRKEFDWSSLCAELQKIFNKGIAAKEADR